MTARRLAASLPTVLLARPRIGTIDALAQFEIDNWEGIIYDPTGAVASATGWRGGVAGQYTAPPDIRVLFGGDLVACEPIEAAFYRCWFT